MAPSSELQPTPRTLVSFVAAAVVSTAVALSLGEYEFDFPLPVLAGLLLSLLLAEIVITGARTRHPVLGAYVGAAAALSIVLAGHLDANNVEPIKPWVWAGAATAFAVGFVRTAGLRDRRTSAGDSDDETAAD